MSKHFRAIWIVDFEDVFGITYLWNSSLKHKVFHTEGRCVHSGDDDYSNTWVTRWRVFCKMKRDVDPALIEHSDRLEVTYKTNKKRTELKTGQPEGSGHTEVEKY